MPSRRQAINRARLCDRSCLCGSFLVRGFAASGAESLRLSDERANLLAATPPEGVASNFCMDGRKAGGFPHGRRQSRKKLLDIIRTDMKHLSEQITAPIEEEGTLSPCPALYSCIATREVTALKSSRRNLLRDHIERHRRWFVSLRDAPYQKQRPG